MSADEKRDASRRRYEETANPEIRNVEAAAIGGATEERRPDRLTLAAFALLVLIGAGNAVAVRISNFDLPPFWSAGVRFGVASLVFWMVVLVRRVSLPGGRALAGVLAYGVLSFGLSYGLLYWALLEVQAGVAQIIVALIPLLTIFFARAHGIEHFRFRGLLGALIATCGIAVAFGEQLSANVPLLPLLAVLLGAACFAESGVVVKLFVRSHPAATNAVGMLVGALLLLAFSLAVGETWVLPATLDTWLASIFLVASSVVVFALFLFVISRWTASAASYQFVLLPFTTVLLAAWLLNEQITPALLIGGGLVLVGVWVGALAHARNRSTAIPKAR